MSETIKCAEIQVGDHVEWIPGTDLTVTAVRHDGAVVDIQATDQDGYDGNHSFAGYAPITRLSAGSAT